MEKKRVRFIGLGFLAGYYVGGLMLDAAILRILYPTFREVSQNDLSHHFDAFLRIKRI